MSFALDPDGRRYGIPTWPWGLAPTGLYTRKQLREMGFRPARGVEPAAQLMWRSRRARSGIRTAPLWLVTQTVQRRKPTAAQTAALKKARAARCVCPQCKREQWYVIPARLGACLDCADRERMAA